MEGDVLIGLNSTGSTFFGYQPAKQEKRDISGAMALNMLNGAIARFSTKSVYSVKMDDIVASIVCGRYSVNFARYLNHGLDWNYIHV